MSRLKRLRPLYRTVYALAPPRSTTVTIDIPDRDEQYEMEFLTRTPIEQERMTGRLMETNRAHLKQILAIVRPKDIIWDVGAHLGRYTCFFAAAAPEGTVLGVEAHPKNAARIEDNLALNDLEATVIQAAVSDTHGEMTFYSRHDEVGEFLSVAIDDSEGHYQYTIPQVTGDDLRSESEALPTLVRIDTGGAEQAVLNGLSDHLAACRRVYVHTYPDRYPDDYEGVHAHLESFGFETDTIDDSRLVMGVRDT